MANLTTTKVSKRLSHDSMSLSAKMPSGASLKFSIGRNGEKLELAFSNDTKVLQAQMSVVKKWIDYREKETNISRFDRLEKILVESKSGSEVISKMEKELK
jgi:hypothetical protein